MTCQNTFQRVDADNGVVYFRSGLLSCTHGFATRIGGMSREVHTASLNLAFGRGDERETVLENLRHFSAAVGIDSSSVVSVHQVHSARVLYATPAMRGEGYDRSTTVECDGYVTDHAGVSLGVKTADCVPILFEDADAGIIGAVHAGWRGTAARITAVCVDEMVRHGAKPESIRAAIGPAIHACCYEVGSDFYREVATLLGEELAGRYITPDHEGKLHADLIGMNAAILISCGIDPERIDCCDLCTCHEPELFYSHRYSHGVRGTMLSVISLPNVTAL